MILIAPVMIPAASAPAIARPMINSDVVCAAADSMDPITKYNCQFLLMERARALPIMVTNANMNNHFTLHRAQHLPYSGMDC
jgi:hypothetical protein